ncbi:hypothetical protein RD792_008717 [Penstemon davidsonii]|uniref:Morc S5 domain-containing protein n=1 Tax=Penstemon davidsonii TaxID=160366 RepID=A0ABR0DBH3_9LAMI|nr:hypothetical protein RD792_008717 [Penstemon davidsonii]
MVETLPEENTPSPSIEIIPISSSSSGSDYSGFCFDDSDVSDVEQNPKKKQRIEALLPAGFLDPIRPEAIEQISPPTVASVPLSTSNIVVKEEIVENSNSNANNNASSVEKEKEKGLISSNVVSNQMIVKTSRSRSCKQFWKAGDYQGPCDTGDSVSQTVGMDHVRVHPKFLHSNATSHKWALGAFAELLDNALDEVIHTALTLILIRIVVIVCHGATYVHVDVLENTKNKDKMLLVEDNGGGMTPNKMRQCMSLGYSTKSKMANTIGQYGNGFKTSTMRLGADVIVFSRCQGKDEQSTTQSIGMLSYTFLTSTGKEDIVVPMIHYEKIGKTWNKQMKSSSDLWQRNLESIKQWSPYESEKDLLQQFDFMKDRGTRIIIYNLWEDDQGSAELDFDTDQHDIQIRGVNRDEKKIEMAKTYPNSKHFLTYRHSLRSYASILYHRFPPGFNIILRGKTVEHHNIVNDMMHTQEITYKPIVSADVASKDLNMVAVVTIGFVKDATHHIDVQGFNVYHKNRLIKPFWRVWNAAGSDGRGVIGVLEANFVEPAHDKQGFERTIVLSRLEAKLVSVQKTYWLRRHAKKSISPENEALVIAKDKSNSTFNENGNITSSTYGASPLKTTSGKTVNSSPVVTDREMEIVGTTEFQPQARNSSPYFVKPISQCSLNQYPGDVQVKTEDLSGDGSMTDLVLRLKEENELLRDRLKNVGQDLQYEKDKNKSFSVQVSELKLKIKQEQEELGSSLSQERSLPGQEEEQMRRRLKDASETIEGLIRKVKLLEMRILNQNCRS